MHIWWFSVCLWSVLTHYQTGNYSRHHYSRGCSSLCEFPEPWIFLESCRWSRWKAYDIMLRFQEEVITQYQLHLVDLKFPILTLTGGIHPQSQVEHCKTLICFSPLYAGFDDFFLHSLWAPCGICICSSSLTFHLISQPIKPLLWRTLWVHDLNDSIHVSHY